MSDPASALPEHSGAPQTPLRPAPPGGPSTSAGAESPDGHTPDDGTTSGAPARRRRRGSRGGRNRSRAGTAREAAHADDGADPEGLGSEIPTGARPVEAHATGGTGETVGGAGPGGAEEDAGTRRPTPRRRVAEGRAPVVDGPGPTSNGGSAVGAPADAFGAAIPPPVLSPAPAAAEPAAGPPPSGPGPSGRVASAAGVPSAAVPARPKIGDSRPAPVVAGAAPSAPPAPARGGGRGGAAGERRPRGERGGGPASDAERVAAAARPVGAAEPKRRRRGGGRSRTGDRQPVEAVLVDVPATVDEETLERRRGRERKGRPVGRYQMVVHSASGVTQIAVLEGRSLIEHYVSRPSDDANQIDGNVYLGRVQNVLPGMEAAFVDIGTPKNAVLYRGDVRYDKDDVDGGGDSGGKPTRGKLPGPARNARIEQLLKPGQTVLCQVTKNPIAHKGARLAQEVSLPGRFVVLIPHSDTYGISKRLADDERKRLRRILDDIRPEGHGLIVRTAAEGATADELRRDVARLVGQWDRIEQLARTSRTPALLYREPDMAVRVIREEFNKDYRAVVIDDRQLYEEVRDYVASISPELADRVEFAGDSDDPLPAFERHHVHEQIHKALDRKVWLPSGGSLIIERTEALTVIDVNTGKNVGTSNLEETVFRNNMEAAEEIARQLRLRDIGGIIVIDFIDMEITANRGQVVKTFREALARDKTRTQVFDISELGLVEMTRKRISEGLVESFSQTCPTCAGRGFVIDDSLL